MKVRYTGLKTIHEHFIGRRPSWTYLAKYGVCPFLYEEAAQKHMHVSVKQMVLAECD